MYNRINSSKIHNAPVPDHNAVAVSINLHENHRGSGYWKMNIDVINDDEYVNGINSLIDQTLQDYEDVAKKLLWELCKIRIREFTINYCSAKRKATKSKITVLEDRLGRLNNDVNATYEDKKNVKMELDKLYIVWRENG